jgi:hypothetical protein
MLAFNYLIRVAERYADMISRSRYNSCAPQ